MSTPSPNRLRARSSGDGRRAAFAWLLSRHEPARSAVLLQRAPLWNDDADRTRSLGDLLDLELRRFEEVHDVQGAGQTGTPVGLSGAGRYWLRRRWLERGARRRDLLAGVPHVWAKLALLGVVAARELCCDLGACAVGVALRGTVALNGSGLDSAAKKRVHGQIEMAGAASDADVLGPAVRVAMAARSDRSVDQDALRRIGVRALSLLWSQLQSGDARRSFNRLIEEHFVRSSILEAVTMATPLDVGAVDVANAVIERWLVESLQRRGPRTIR